jgi:hypothetical protein
LGGAFLAVGSGLDDERGAAAAHRSMTTGAPQASATPRVRARDRHSALDAADARRSIF